MTRRSRTRSSTLVALGLALAGLIAIASGTAIGDSARAGSADRLVLLIDIAVLAVAGFVVAFAIAILLRGVLIARGPAMPSLGAWLLRTVPVASAAVAVMCLMLIAWTDLGRPMQASGRPGSPAPSSDRSARPLTIPGWTGMQVRAGEDQSTTEATDPQEPVRGGLRTFLVPSVLLLMLAGAAWQWQVSRSARAEQAADRPLPDGGMEQAVQGAVARTIDAMLADPDPTTAIRGAYARLLEGLEGIGAGRHAHEAPMEHVQRVLTTLRARPEPLRQLTELFEIARFSTRPLTSADREQALQALRAVAVDLGSGARV